LDLAAEYRFPILTGDDFGHNQLNLPMSIGVRAAIAAGRGELRLPEAAVV